MYAVYHGPDGLKRIAEKIHSAALVLAKGEQRRLDSWGLEFLVFIGVTLAGNSLDSDSIFDTLKVTSTSTFFVYLSISIFTDQDARSGSRTQPSLRT